MRIAGVHLSSGQRVWADAGDLDVGPLDPVRVRVGDTERSGWVFATPEQLSPGPDQIGAMLLSLTRRESAHVPCEHLPRADMPPLGSMVETERGVCRVTAIDPVKRTIVLTYAGGDSEITPAL